MSAATFAREGYTAFLDSLLYALPLTVRLYTNDPVISAASVRADFIQATYAEYAPYTIPRWVPAALRGGIAIAVPDIPHFVQTVAPWSVPIRGYYVTHGPTGPLAFAWRRPGDGFQFGPDATILTTYIRFEFPCPT